MTGLSSGFGRMAADALARAGHVVFASMRDTAGHNARQAADVEAFARKQGVDIRPIELDVASEASAEGAIAAIVAATADPEDVARTIVKVVDTPFGKRPFRVHIDPTSDGAEVVNGVADRVRGEFLRRIGLGDLLKARVA